LAHVSPWRCFGDKKTIGLCSKIKSLAAYPFQPVEAILSHDARSFAFDAGEAVGAGNQKKLF
jgi:hypothetical protein